jgi:MinD superfamily P-loop ATPase
LALLVTEPTVAGIHDLLRALQTLQHFGVPALVCINKADVWERVVAVLSEAGAGPHDERDDQRRRA